ncbi:MAG: D-alanyl-D-alanine carboxypeptidase/D-alanyl-D-alanine-endopeptidase [Burkholderiaceae bacterium]
MRILFILLIVSTWAQAAPLEPPVARWLQDAGVATVKAGLEVRAVDDGSVLAAVGAADLLNPASVIKVLTGWAALGLLGDDYRWRTRFFLNGPLLNGRLNGDLVIVGGGDPKLVVEDLTEIVSQMRALGLQHIGGDVLLDDSLYIVDRQRADAFDGLISEPYNVRPNAVMMNFKSTKFTLSPVSGKVAVELDPPLAGVRVENQLRLVKGSCRHRARDITVINAGSSARPAIRLQGKYSRGCKTQSSFHAVLNHRQFIDAFFRAGWEAAGGSLGGHARFSPGKLAAMTKLSGKSLTSWYQWDSPRTLGDVVSDINKFSNNVMTRQLLLQLAATSGAQPANRAAGLRAVHAWLRLNGLSLPGLILENGSGLSRETRISASGLTRVLVKAANSEQGQRLRESLPIAGVDGTMRWRLNKSAVAGQAWIKTGSLDQVRSIAGYVRAGSGKMYALTMIVNGPGARRSHPVQDALIQWVYDNG